MWTKLNTALRGGLLTAVLCYATMAAGFQLQEGTNYRLVATPQPVESSNRIEVIEFFSFACPHCNHFEPTLESWIKTLPSDVVFRRVPALFQPSWVEYAKIWYTLVALGKEDLAGAVFRAVHEQNILFNDDAAFFDWAAKQGLDRRRVADVYNSFAVNSQMQHARAQTQAYRIEGVPAMVIDGKYFVDGSTTGTYDVWMATANALIAKARQEHSAKAK